MSKTNLLLLCGGGSSEHDISLLSAKYLEQTLSNYQQYNVLCLELTAEGRYKTQQGDSCELNNDKKITFSDPLKSPWPVDYAIPCIHGYPGETGDIQSCFELINLPYFGCQSEASITCFNKVSAKMWFSALGIPNTPYLFLDSLTEDAMNKTKQALIEWGSVFIKASNQGSSIGCYRVDDINQLEEKLAEAFNFSAYVVVEKTIKARELEVAVFEHQGEVVATLPGEIVCAQNTFYSFDEKYDANSQAITHIVAPNLNETTKLKMQEYAIKAFKGLKLRHLSRIDFFVTDNDEILLNEINTFPGLTPISMFPKMLINSGLNFGDWLTESISSQIAKKS